MPSKKATKKNIPKKVTKNNPKKEVSKKITKKDTKVESTSIDIFTDGSCLGNGKKDATAGYGVHFPSGTYKDIKGKFVIEPITNQRAELFAIYKVIRFFKINKLFKKYETINIYTDSQYSINCLTVWAKKWAENDWKSGAGDVKNTDLIKPIITYLEKYTNIKLIHVRAHTGKTDYFSKSNAVVDVLAKDGREGN